MKNVTGGHDTETHEKPDENRAEAALSPHSEYEANTCKPLKPAATGGDMRHAFDPLDVARFWKYVDVQDHGKCWPWTAGVKSTGYGEFVMPDRKEPAHRVAYQIAVGPIPAGLVVRHKCDNPVCCNPKHLETGTHADNVRDRVIRGRSAIGEAAGRAILTESDVYRVRDTPRDQWKAMADELGVDRMTVYMAGSGRSWKHLPMTVEAPPAPPATTTPIVIEHDDGRPLADTGLVHVSVAARKLGISEKRLLGYIYTENTQGGLHLPIGDYKTQEVYGWSCQMLAARLQADIKSAVQS